MPADNAPPDSPADDRRARAGYPQRWLILAGRASSVRQHEPAVRDLLFARHTVRIAYGTGRLNRERYRTARPRRLLAPLGRKDLRWVWFRGAYAVLPEEHRLRPGAKAATWFDEEVSRADHVLLMDPEAEGLEPLVRNSGASAAVWRPHDVERVLEEEHAWRWLEHEARRLSLVASTEQAKTSRVSRLTRLTRLLESYDHFLHSPGRDVRPELRRLARHRLREGAFRDVIVCDRAAAMMHRFFGPSSEDVAFQALRTHVGLVDGLAAPSDLDSVVRQVLVEADAALGAGDLADAASLGSVGLGLLFHQQLHTAVPSTPLVQDPDRFLSPLRSSAVGLALGRPATTRDTAGTRPEFPLRVVALPGAYGHHMAPLLSALEADPRSELVTLPLHDKIFSGMMIDTPILEHRLARSDPSRARVPWSLVPDAAVEALAGADVVIADWADKGAAWASVDLPDRARLVVRVHSVDVLSAPIHLLDWHRVDDVVFVSDHIRDVFNAVMGDRAAKVRQHVVTNIVSPSRFPDPLLPAAGRTLGVIGWGQRVKDPLMALEILARLRERDSAWRLRLVGTDFGPSKVRADQDYARAFRTRALQPDVVDSIDYAGYTRNIPAQVRHMGFVLSTSVRESCPVGVLEGTAGGAVPFVREWPAFSRFSGAARLFPAACVYDTVDEVVERIWSLEQPDARALASRQVLQQMSDNFSEKHTEQRLLDLILGG